MITVSAKTLKGEFWYCDCPDCHRQIIFHPNELAKNGEYECPFCPIRKPTKFIINYLKP